MAGGGDVKEPSPYNGDGDREGEPARGGRAKGRGEYSRSSSIGVVGSGSVESRNGMDTGLEDLTEGVMFRFLLEIGRGRSVLRVDLSLPSDLSVHGGQMY